MAAITVTVTKLARNGGVEMPTATALTSTTDGAEVDYTGQSDGRILLLIENGNASAAETATVKAGNGIQGTEDLVVSVPAQKTLGLVLESGKFAFASGERKGKVWVVGESTNIKVAAVALP